MDGVQRFNRTIREHLIDNTRYLSGRMDYIPTFLRIAKRLREQEQTREGSLQVQGVTVPTILIISVTNACNLSCHGCYACHQVRAAEHELTTAEIRRIVGEAVSAGVGIIFLAGGEPLLKEDILSIPKAFRDTLFVMFTNGTLLDETVMNRIRKLRNLVPAISLEGNDETTNQRRGDGVFRVIKQAMAELDWRKMLFGASITLTRENYDEVMEHAFLHDLENSGCRTLFLIEYVPCEGDPERCLTEEQKRDLLVRVGRFPSDYRMLPVALPGDESRYGGCLAAGRGFLHVGSDGSLEACPFAPYSDVNLKDVSFIEALRSGLLNRIREHHHLLEEAEGGCALFENRDWVEGLLKGRE